VRVATLANYLYSPSSVLSSREPHGSPIHFSGDSLDPTFPQILIRISAKRVPSRTSRIPIIHYTSTQAKVEIIKDPHCVIEARLVRNVQFGGTLVQQDPDVRAADVCFAFDNARDRKEGLGVGKETEFRGGVRVVFVCGSSIVCEKPEAMAYRVERKGLPCMDCLALVHGSKEGEVWVLWEWEWSGMKVFGGCGCGLV
jgi:hypothetical protein